MDPDDNEYRWVLAGAAMLTQVGCLWWFSIHLQKSAGWTKTWSKLPKDEDHEVYFNGFYSDVSGFPSLVDAWILVNPHCYDTEILWIYSVSFSPYQLVQDLLNPHSACNLKSLFTQFVGCKFLQFCSQGHMEKKSWDKMILIWHDAIWLSDLCVLICISYY